MTLRLLTQKASFADWVAPGYPIVFTTTYEACLFKTMTEARLTPNSMLAQSERHGVRVASGNRQRPEMVLSQMMEVLEIAVLYV